MRLYDKIVWTLFLKLMAKRGFSTHLFRDETDSEIVAAIGFTQGGASLEVVPPPATPAQTAKEGE